MKIIKLLLIAALAILNTAQAGGNPEAGKKKAQTCQSCHGPQGKSTNPTFPILAGQYEDYLVQELHEYKSGKRKNGIMNGMAANLSDQDIADIAAYFSQQDGSLSTLPR